MTKRFSFFLFSVLFSFLAGMLGGSLADTIEGKMGLNPLNNPGGTASETAPTTTVVEESDTISVVEKTKPSVVSIVISKKLEQQSTQNPFGDPFFDQFFGQPEQEPETQDGTVEVGEGSGFVVSADGMIVTNRHVVEDADASYTVVFDDGKKFDATVLDRDNLTDVAVLKIDAQDLTALPLGDSSALKEGQAVITIGNTLGEYTNTVTKGVVSGLARDLGGEYTGLIQTDAAISQGNSGGPLLNLTGEVVGINTAVDRAGDNLGFAIPINEVKFVVDSVQANGKIVRPALGIRYVPINAEIAEANKLLYDYGAYVRGSESEPAVIPGSAADLSGIQEGDIILEIDGKKITVDSALPTLLRTYNIGDTVTLKVIRKGKEKEMKVTLAELPNTE